MRDVENGDAELFLEPLQAAQHRGAQRGVHHRHRFIGQDNARLEHDQARADHARWRWPPLN